MADLAFEQMLSDLSLIIYEIPKPCVFSFYFSYICSLLLQRLLLLLFLKIKQILDCVLFAGAVFAYVFSATIFRLFTEIGKIHETNQSCLMTV